MDTIVSSFVRQKKSGLVKQTSAFLLYVEFKLKTVCHVYVCVVYLCLCM